MSNVTINKTDNSVEIRVGSSTYLLHPEQYDELWHTMREEENYASDVLWTSVVTNEFIDPLHAQTAIEELNDFVANTCMDFAPEEDEDNE